MARQYSRISSNDTKVNLGSPPEPSYLKSPSTTSVVSTTSVASTSDPTVKSIGHRISDKIHALAWVSIALFTVKHTDTIHVVLASEVPIRPLLHIAITQITINTILMLYLGVYLPKIKGLKDSEAWSVYCPRVIPFMTMNGIICIYTFTRSLWPVWGFLTPFILGIEALGLLFSTHFIPWV